MASAIYQCYKREINHETIDKIIIMYVGKMRLLINIESSINMLK